MLKGGGRKARYAVHKRKALAPVSYPLAVNFIFTAGHAFGSSGIGGNIGMMFIKVHFNKLSRFIIHSCKSIDLIAYGAKPALDIVPYIAV